MPSRRVDAFGIQVVQNPEEFLAQNEEYTDQLVDTAQAAFSAEGIPTREDTVNHVLPVSTLVLAYDQEQKEYVGFSSTDRVAGTVYENGIAVAEDSQRNGLGKAMLSLSLLEEMEDSEETVTYRTQSPVMYDCSTEVFNAYPRPGEETPEEVEESLQDVAEALDPDAEYQNSVMTEAYPEPMYSGILEGETRHFMEQRGMDYEEGDAMLVGGQVTEEEMAQAVDQYIAQSDVIAKVSRV